MRLLRSLVALLLFPIAATAQSTLLLRPTEASFIGAEYLFPSVEFEDITWYSGALFLTLRTSLTPALSLYADLPTYRVTFNDFINGQPGTSSGVGNPYIGLEIDTPQRTMGFELGVRPPIAGNRNAAGARVVAFADLERVEAFTPEILSLRGLMHVTMRRPSGLNATWRAGLMHMHYYGSGSTDATENQVVYGVGLAYAPRTTRVEAAINGRWRLEHTESGSGAKTLHQLGLGVRTRRGDWQPGVQLRFPLDEDFRGGYDATLSFSVAFSRR